MASAFLRKTSQSVGTAVTQVGGYAVPAATKVTAVGLLVANKTANQILVSASLRNSGGTDTFFAVNIPIPTGSTLDIIDGSKINMEPGDSIYIASSAASSVDVILSVVEII